MVAGIGCAVFCGFAHAQTNLAMMTRDTCRTFVSIVGNFNNHAAWNVNLTNAALSQVSEQPRDIDIEPSSLSVLNDRLPSVFFALLDSMGFRYSSRESDRERWQRMAGPLENDSDVFYSMNVLIDGDNGMGGRFGGLDVRIKFTSMHRNQKLVYGFGAATVKSSSDSTVQLAYLRSALSDVLGEALSDWDAVLREERQRPRKQCTLVLDIHRFKIQQRAFIENVLMSCVHAQVDGFDYVKKTKDKFAYQIHYRLDHREDENAFLMRYASTIRLSVGSHGKYPCSLWKSPMEGYRTSVEVDTTGRSITWRWVKDD